MPDTRTDLTGLDRFVDRDYLAVRKASEELEGHTQWAAERVKELERVDDLPREAEQAFVALLDMAKAQTTLIGAVTTRLEKTCRELDELRDQVFRDDD